MMGKQTHRNSFIYWQNCVNKVYLKQIYRCTTRSKCFWICIDVFIPRGQNRQKKQSEGVRSC